MNQEYDLEDLRRTLRRYPPIDKIIEAVVTGNIGYLNEPPKLLDLPDKPDINYLKLRLHLEELEDKYVFYDWEKMKRFPLVEKMDVYELYLKLV